MQRKPSILSMNTIGGVAMTATIVMSLAASPAAGQSYGRNGIRMPVRPTQYESSKGAMSQIPPLADMTGQPTAEELQQRAEVREYGRQIREILHKYLGNKNKPELREEGLGLLKEFTDPAAFLPLIEETADEQDDVKRAVLDHLQSQGEWGQAALAWLTIHERNEAVHYEALKRLTKPASQPVLSVIDAGLRSEDDFVANLSGMLSGHLDIIDTIPLLIHGQSRTRRVQEPGDDAWILVGTQRVFIRALIPIVGDNSGAFLPVPGVLTDGVVMRIVEAVAVVYRTEIHRTLVTMTTRDWGQSTASLGYDPNAWQAWYNDEYLPYKAEQALVEKMIDEQPEKSGG